MMLFNIIWIFLFYIINAGFFYLICALIDVDKFYKGVGLCLMKKITKVY